jgi:hypothetical protein
MTLFRSAALAVVLVLAAPSLAFAQQECAYGQHFVAGDISVSGAFLRASVKGARSAGAYLVIDNAGTEADRLVGVSSAAAPDISIHEMQLEGDMMKMSALSDGLVVPAGGHVALEPKGYHLMLTGMPKPFVAGECVEMVLHFERAGDLQVMFNVGAIAQQTAPTGEAGHDMSSMGH